MQHCTDGLSGAPSPGQPSEPVARMTLRVYTVNPRTRERTLLRTTTVTGTGPLPALGISTEYPSCGCPRCVPRPEGSAGR